MSSSHYNDIMNSLGEERLDKGEEARAVHAGDEVCRVPDMELLMQSRAGYRIINAGDGGCDHVH